MSRNRKTALEFQRPLFDGYEIGVEFEKRWKHVDTLAAACSAAEESATVVERLTNGLCLCSLELSTDRSTLEVIAAGGMVGTQEPLYEYIYRIPFQGDPELWALKPAKRFYFSDLQLEGEIHRGNLILAFIVASSEEAEELFATAVNELKMVIDAQAMEVGSFNHALPPLIWHKLMQYRTGGYVSHCAETRH